MGRLALHTIAMPEVSGFRRSTALYRVHTLAPSCSCRRTKLCAVALEQSPRTTRSQAATSHAAIGLPHRGFISGYSVPRPPGSLLNKNNFTKPATAAPQLTRPRARVAVDVDEVLGRFVYALNRFCLEKYQMDYSVENYWVYEFAKIWGCTPEKSNQIVHEFFKSPHFNEGIPVIPGAYDALVRLSNTCDLVVVTSRQHVIQDATLDWIDKHYPSIFSEVYFGNHFAMHGTSRKKSDICKSIGASVLIDDNPAYALECAAAGIHVLLYDWHAAYPWSKLPPGSPTNNITVVRDWGEVEHQLEVLAPIIS